MLETSKPDRWGLVERGSGSGRIVCVCGRAAAAAAVSSRPSGADTMPDKGETVDGGDGNAGCRVFDRWTVGLQNLRVESGVIFQ